MVLNERYIVIGIDLRMSMPRGLVACHGKCDEREKGRNATRKRLSSPADRLAPSDLYLWPPSDIPNSEYAHAEYSACALGFLTGFLPKIFAPEVNFRRTFPVCVIMMSEKLMEFTHDLNN